MIEYIEKKGIKQIMSMKLLIKSNYQGWINFGTKEQHYRSQFTIEMSEKTGKIYKKSFYLKPRKELMKSKVNFDCIGHNKFKAKNMELNELKEIYQYDESVEVFF